MDRYLDKNTKLRVTTKDNLAEILSLIDYSGCEIVDIIVIRKVGVMQDRLYIPDLNAEKLALILNTLSEKCKIDTVIVGNKYKIYFGNVFLDVEYEKPLDSRMGKKIDFKKYKIRDKVIAKSIWGSIKGGVGYLGKSKNLGLKIIDNGEGTVVKCGNTISACGLVGKKVARYLDKFPKEGYKVYSYMTTGMSRNRQLDYLT